MRTHGPQKSHEGLNRGWNPVNVSAPHVHFSVANLDAMLPSVIPYVPILVTSQGVLSPPLGTTTTSLLHLDLFGSLLPLCPHAPVSVLLLPIAGTHLMKGRQDFVGPLAHTKKSQSV